MLYAVGAVTRSERSVILRNVIAATDIVVGRIACWLREGGPAVKIAHGK